MASADPKTIADPRAMRGACYRCTHRRALSGNTHSGCRHPLTAAAHQLPIAAMIEALGQALPVPVPGLEVAGDSHAIAMGWWAWPYNFDPTWLVACNGFESAP